MFKIELDLHLIYEPPMDDKSVGIVVTRSIELPFVPFNGLRVFSRGWEDSPEPFGLELSDVQWDLDRRVFLAKTKHHSVDFPVAYIPIEIRTWLERGWRWGSYEDRYDNDDTSIDPPVRPVLQMADPAREVNDATVEALHTLPPKKRPTAFNAFFKAMIRQMASTYSNMETAYAMDKSGRYLGSGRIQSTDADGVAKWKELQNEWRRLPTDDHIKWMDKVRKYPDLADIVLGSPAEKKLCRAR